MAAATEGVPSSSAYVKKNSTKRKTKNSTVGRDTSDDATTLTYGNTDPIITFDLSHCSQETIDAVCATFKRRRMLGSSFLARQIIIYFAPILPIDIQERYADVSTVEKVVKPDRFAIKDMYESLKQRSPRSWTWMDWGNMAYITHHYLPSGAEGGMKFIAELENFRLKSMNAVRPRAMLRLWTLVIALTVFISLVYSGISDGIYKFSGHYLTYYIMDALGTLLMLLWYVCAFINDVIVLFCRGCIDLLEVIVAWIFNQIAISISKLDALVS